MLFRSDTLKQITSEAVSDEQMAHAAERFPINPPKNKEEYYYRSIFCALMNIDSPLEVSNGDLSTFPTWTDKTDSRIVAFGIKVQKTTQDGWVEFDIPLDYYQTNVIPKYLVIVAASSKYGDFFHGSSSSVLYLDDFELRY